MLTNSYINATLRAVLPVCPNRKRLGLAFDINQTPILRIALSVEDSITLRNLLDNYIKSFASDQSDGSELIPSDAISVPSEGVNT